MTTKLKCILLDDELPGLTYLKILCEQISALEIVKAFNDPQKFLHESATLDFELCILDIEMPRLNGVHVAGLLKDKLVIFNTAYRNYAADAFDLNAVDYIQKPVTLERLQVAVKKAIDRKAAQSQQKQFIQLNTDQGRTVIPVDNLVYITTSDVDSRDKLAVMADCTSFILKNISFETLQRQLPVNAFCRVNKKQLLALRMVASFTHEEVTTTVLGNGKAIKISLSETYRQQFQNSVRRLS